MIVYYSVIHCFSRDRNRRFFVFFSFSQFLLRSNCIYTSACDGKLCVFNEEIGSVYFSKLELNT